MRSFIGPSVLGREHGFSPCCCTLLHLPARTVLLRVHNLAFPPSRFIACSAAGACADPHKGAWVDG